METGLKPFNLRALQSTITVLNKFRRDSRLNTRVFKKRCSESEGNREMRGVLFRWLRNYLQFEPSTNIPGYELHEMRYFFIILRKNTSFV